MGDREAVPLLESLLAKEEEHVLAHYLLGQILLARGDETGIDYLETAMSKDGDVVVPGCKLIYDFLCQQGKRAEANLYVEKVEKYHRSKIWPG